MCRHRGTNLEDYAAEVCKWSNCLFVFVGAGMLCHAGCVASVCLCLWERLSTDAAATVDFMSCMDVYLVSNWFPRLIKHSYLICLHLYYLLLIKIIYSAAYLYVCASLCMCVCVQQEEGLMLTHSYNNDSGKAVDEPLTNCKEEREIERKGERERRGVGGARGLCSLWHLHLITLLPLRVLTHTRAHTHTYSLI